MKILKDNLSTFLMVLAFAIISTSLTFWVFISLKEYRIKNRVDGLKNQVQLCSDDLEQVIAQFEEDFYYFILSNDNIDDYSAGNNQLARNIQNFLEHHDEIVDSVFIVKDSIQLKSYFDNQKSLVLLEDPSMKIVDFDQLKNLDFQLIPESNYLVYKHEDLIYVLSTSPSRLITQKLGNYYLGKGGCKFIYNSYFGLIPIEGPTQNAEAIVNLSIDASTEKSIANSAQSATQSSFQANAKLGKENYKLLLEQYPIKVFGTDYAIIFGSDEQEELSQMATVFYVVAGTNLLLIIIVAFMFSYSMKRLRNTSDRLAKSKDELAALVKQQKLLFEYSEDFTYRYDKDGNYDYVSENIQRVLGYTPEQYARPENRKISDNPVNIDARRFKEQILQGIEKTGFYQEVYNSNREPRMLEVKEKPITDDKGNVSAVIGISKDVTEKFASDQKFRVLFEFSTDPYFIYDNDGIIDCNDAAIKILEVVSKDEIIGSKLSEYSPDRQPDGRSSKYKAEEVDNIANERKYHKFEWTHVSSKGAEFPVEVTLTPVRLNHSQVMLCVWHDLTERKRVEQVLIESKKRAEELAAQKQQFLSSMSHEIRTPLNAVIGITHFLMEEDPKPDQVDKLRTLKFSADNLLSLVNDILDHSKIESGKIIFSNERFDLYERLTGLKEIMYVKAAAKGIALKLHMDEQIPRYVKGDAVRFNQILLNIVSNGIKFTEKGSVDIYTKLLGQTKNHVELEFQVADTGIGIEKEKLQSIFETFTQANANILNTYGGTGLGLAITKNLIELQGGTIQVESELGKGSVFSFKLSFDKVNQTQQSIDDALPDKSLTLKGSKILLVEDNPINQKIASQFLNNWGAQVEVASNGRESLDKVAQKKYDLILMDIQMPEMDGYETTRAIRAIDDEYYKNIPIISLTADAFTEVRDRVLESGMTDYVTKPINPDQFLSTVSKHYKPKG